MPAVITDLEQIKQLANDHHDDFEVMRYMLEMDDDINDEALDSLVDTVAAPIIAAIDCTKCGNCCRSLDVYLTEQDAQRISDGIHIPIDDIMTEHIDQESAAEVGEWGKLRARPCAFLEDNLCSIYPHRPESCRTYPVFTPDFRWTLADTIAGAGGCPIIYNVLVAMLDKVDEITTKTKE